MSCADGADVLPGAVGIGSASPGRGGSGTGAAPVAPGAAGAPTGATPPAPGAAATVGAATGATPVAPGAEDALGAAMGSTPAAPGAAGAVGAATGAPGSAGAVGPADAGAFGRVVKTGFSFSSVSCSVNVVRSPADGRVSPGVVSGGASPSTGGGLMAIVVTRYFGVSRSRFAGRTAPAATVAANTSMRSTATGPGPFTFVDGTLNRICASAPTRPTVMFAGATGTRCSGASGGPLRPHATAHAATAMTASRRATDIRGCSATDRCCPRCRPACDRRTPRLW
jgi:regulator of sigma E protease